MPGRAAGICWGYVLLTVSGLNTIDADQGVCAMLMTVCAVGLTFLAWREHGKG
jgi:hypothetical protein